MTGAVATVVRCGDLLGAVYSTLVSIERQTVGRGETVLVTDPSTPMSARDWLDAVAERQGIVVVHATAASPGAVKNAGIGRTTCPHIVCVDAGDRLDPSYHAACQAALDDRAEAVLATTTMVVHGPGAVTRVVSSDGCTLEALLASSRAVHGASMFRREAWTANGGFDETLPCLDDYEFFLRLLGQAPHKGALVDRPLFLHARRPDALVDRWWGTEEYTAAFNTIVERHSGLFRSAVVGALSKREHELNSIGATYRELMSRHEETKREIAEYGAHATALDAQLPSEIRGRVGVDLGDLRRTSPVARNWGYERGVPIDRYYIERFLERNQHDIRGAVLEVQEADYTVRFGGDRVTRSDIVDLNVGNEGATIISDLRTAANIASNTYDCIILTQTVHVIDDIAAAITECHRILRPAGVLLATLPCASRVCLEYGDRGDFWRVTVDGARELFSRSFSEAGLEIQGRGNVLVNAAFMYGLACHELSEAEFGVDDPYNPLLVTVRAVKASTAPERTRPVGGQTEGRATGGAVLLYHRVGAPDSDVHGLSVSSQQFRAHLVHLCDHYRPMPLRELTEAVASRSIPHGAVALTFDDGYLDNATTVSPLLLEFGVPATFFVTTDALGTTDTYEFWWDVLEESLLVAPNTSGAPLVVELPTGTHRLATGTDAERAAAHSHIYSAISRAGPEERESVIDAVSTWSQRDQHAGTRARRLTADELRDLAARPGHQIGAHSVRHLMLPSHPVATQRREVVESRTALEAVLGRSVEQFAYPFGALDESTVDAVRAAGFRSAVTCEETSLSSTSDLFRLPRWEVTPQRSAMFDTWLARTLSNTV